MVYEHDSKGNPIAGSKSALMNDIRQVCLHEIFEEKMTRLISITKTIYDSFTKQKA